MMRCRNFRRQSTQSEEMSRTRGRRDSCAQISDGTVNTMTVETTAAFYDTSTQTGSFQSVDLIHSSAPEAGIRNSQMTSGGLPAAKQLIRKLIRPAVEF
jgi:hypothetical protein